MTMNFKDIPDSTVSALASTCKLMGLTPEQLLLLNKKLADGDGMCPAFHEEILDIEKTLAEMTPEQEVMLNAKLSEVLSTMILDDNPKRRPDFSIRVNTLDPKDSIPTGKIPRLLVVGEDGNPVKPKGITLGGKDYPGTAINMDKILDKNVRFTCPCDDSVFGPEGGNVAAMKESLASRSVGPGNTVKANLGTYTKVDVVFKVFANKGKRRRGIGHANRKVKTYSVFVTEHGEKL